MVVHGARERRPPALLALRQPVLELRLALTLTLTLSPTLPYPTLALALTHGAGGTGGDQHGAHPRAGSRGGGRPAHHTVRLFSLSLILPCLSPRLVVATSVRRSTVRTSCVRGWGREHK